MIFSYCWPHAQPVAAIIIVAEHPASSTLLQWLHFMHGYCHYYGTTALSLDFLTSSMFS